MKYKAVFAICHSFVTHFLLYQSDDYGILYSQLNNGRSFFNHFPRGCALPFHQICKCLVLLIYVLTRIEIFVTILSLWTARGSRNQCRTNLTVSLQRRGFSPWYHIDLLVFVCIVLEFHQQPYFMHGFFSASSISFMPRRSQDAAGALFLCLFQPLKLIRS